jgi:hypothetical protein
MSKLVRFRLVIILAAIWVILLPPWWAQNLSARYEIPYLEFLGFYIPELIVAASSVVLLPAAWMQKQWAVAGLIAAATLLPILKLSLGSPTSNGAWVVSSALLLLLAYGAHVQSTQVTLHDRTP